MANEGEPRWSETRENEGWEPGTVRILQGSTDPTVGSSGVRLRNLTGVEVRLIYRGPDGSEATRRIPKDPVQVRVRYNRLFDRSPVEWSGDPEGTTLRIGVIESRPREGVLPTCESVENLPPAEGGVRLIVHPGVVFALARRGIHRRDLVTVGLARKDPVTHHVIGYENLSRVDFDRQAELEELSSLSSARAE